MKHSKLKFLVLIAISVIGLSSMVLGQQDTGQLNGSVKDQNDAAITGATVKLINTRTNAAKATTTNSDGYYVFTSVPPGDYEIDVSATGFQNIKSKAQVTVGGAASVNIQLGVANVNVDVVDVPAGAGGVAEVNTTDQTQSTVVNQRQLSSLPIQDRDPYSLVRLSGNISEENNSSMRGLGFSINGQRGASTNILLDGTENVSTFFASLGQTVPQDSVSEFRVITSNFGAEFGRATGGIVSVVTKSGGNRFEGSVFSQNRNSALSSNSFNNNSFGIKKGVFNRNQFGYGITGPIKKDKLFFSNFGEWLRIRSFDSTLVYVPSSSCIAAMHPNARAFFTQYGQRSSAATTAGPSRLLNGCSFDLLSYTAAIDAGGGDPENGYNNVARVDWNISDRTSAYFSYKIQSDSLLPGSKYNSPYDGYNTSEAIRNQNMQGSFVHNLTSTFIFDAKVAYRRLQITPTLGEKDPNTPTLYAFAFGSAILNNQLVAFPGYIPFNPGFGFDSVQDEKLLDVKPNFSYIAGNHIVRFGGQYIHLNNATTFGAFQNASQNLAQNLGDAVNALLVTGMTSQFQVAVDPQGRFPGGTINLPVKAPNFKRTNVYNEWALYANDQWKIAPNFTLNLGLRYEYYGPQKSKEGLDSNFYFGSGDIFQSIRSGTVDIASNKGGLWKADKNNWAPRVGFAWDVMGDGKSSVRGGYGISFERNFGNVTFNVIQNPPFYAVLGVNNVPISTNNFGPLGASSGTAQLPAVTLRVVDPDIVNAFSHQWGASVERQIASATVLKFDYSGSAGRNLYSVSNINRRGTGLRYLGTSGTGCAPGGNSDRLNCQYGNINFRGSDGTSNYNGLTTSLESNNLFGKGLVTTLRYTYSVAKDNLSSTFSEGQSGEFGLGYLDPFNPMLDYGYADSDVRHRFVGSMIYPIPFKLKNRIANSVLGGWNISSIVTIRSGSPFTIFDCTNARTVCTRALRSPVTVNGTRVQTGANNYNFIDLSGFTPIGPTDPTGTNETGPYPDNMLGRNTFRRPGFWNVDASVYKNIGLSERFKLQLRADAFNFFNHANLFVNGGTADVTNGIVNAFFDGRRTIQVSAKLHF